MNSLILILQTALKHALTLFFIILWSTVTVFKLLKEWWAFSKQPNAGVFGAEFFASAKERRKAPNLLANGWRDGFLQLSQIKMHYVEAGDPSKPLMVLVHGFPEFWYSYRFQLKYFQKDYHVVALDLRGYNETDKPDGVENYEISKLATDLEEAIIKLGGKAILIAHDWGGAIAWTVAIRRPDLIAERFVALNIPHPLAFGELLRTYPPQMIKSWYMYMFQVPGLAEFFIKHNDFKTFHEWFREIPTDLLTENDYEAWKYVFSKPGALTPPLNYYRSIMRNGRSMDKLPPVQPKTLIIWGEADFALDVKGAELSLQYCRDAKLAKLPGISHWVQQHAPDKVNQLIEEFIKK